MGERPCCALCGEPMPEGEEMFRYHGYSGPCPKPQPAAAPVPDGERVREYERLMLQLETAIQEDDSIGEDSARADLDRLLLPLLAAGRAQLPVMPAAVPVPELIESLQHAAGTHELTISGADCLALLALLSQPAASEDALRAALSEIAKRANDVLTDPDHDAGADVWSHDAIGVIANIAEAAIRRAALATAADAEEKP